MGLHVLFGESIERRVRLTSKRTENFQCAPSAEPEETRRFDVDDGGVARRELRYKTVYAVACSNNICGFSSRRHRDVFATRKMYYNLITIFRHRNIFNVS